MTTLLAVSCNSESMKERYVVEIIGQGVEIGEVEDLAIKSGADDTRLYKWETHLAIYSGFSDVTGFEEEIKTAYPNVQIKIYKDPFYQFKIVEHRENYTPAKEWKHIMLTANLVDDVTKQQEYLDYHNTQFEKWPEIARGFCNAEFQELNTYINGRQLMLVISIPADKIFEEINPKTWENNPRVDDWNTIMSGYQVGIEGTKPNDTWVFLNEVK